LLYFLASSILPLTSSMRFANPWVICSPNFSMLNIPKRIQIN
jgi:hypothetical protein